MKIFLQDIFCSAALLCNFSLTPVWTLAQEEHHLRVEGAQAFLVGPRGSNGLSLLPVGYGGAHEDKQVDVVVATKVRLVKDVAVPLKIQHLSFKKPHKF